MTDPVASPPAARTRRRWPWLLGALLLALPLALAAALAAAWQALHTEAGTRWWLTRVADRVPGLQLEAPAGALLGAAADFRLARLAWRGPGGERVQVDALQLTGLTLRDWRLAPPFVDVRARRLAARRVAVQGAAEPPRDAPPAAPRSLRLPLTAVLEQVAVDRLELPGLPAPIESLAASVEVGPVHRVEGLALRWRGLALQGHAQIDADAPLAVQARLALRADAEAGSAALLPLWAKDVALDVQAHGPLERLAAEATLAMQDQRLDASAELTPFAALPLAQLQARFERLDLARLAAVVAPAASVPATALSGRATLALQAGQPPTLQLDASNALPGRWDALRLPVERIVLQAGGSAGHWRIDRADVALASAPGVSAGRVNASATLGGRATDESGAPGGGANASGPLRSPANENGALNGQANESGPLRGRVSSAQLLFTDVALAELDRRAPAVRLSGPVDLAHTAAPDAAAGFGTLAFDARLRGRLLGAARGKAPAPLREAVQLAARGSASADRLHLERLAIEAGSATLTGRADARKTSAPTQQWDTEADLRLVAFDPALWLPGESQAAWRRARNRLNGHALLKARVPAAATQATALLAALRGTLRLEVQDSELAGQPLALQLAAEADGAGALRADLDAKAADNSLSARLALRAPTRGSTPGSDQLALRLDAPALARLAPLAGAAGLATLAGRVAADLQVEGGLGTWLLGGSEAARGPLATRGSASVAALRAGPLQLQSASAEWNASLPGNASQAAALAQAVLQARVRATQLRMPGLLVPEASLDADGSLAEHHARLQATLRQLQPGGSGAVQAEAARTASADPAAARRAAQADASVAGPAASAEPSPLALDARLDGRWEAGAGAETQQRWRATLAELSLRPVAAVAAPSAAAANPGSPPLPLLQARDVRIELLQSPERLRVQAEPGRAEVLGAVLRWSQLRWERAGAAPARIDAQAEVEPLRVAALLQRLQPDFGWSGDLLLGARAVVRSDPQVSAQVEVARVSGDLSVTEFGNVQALGLRELRFALEAERGSWVFTQQFEGTQIGRLGGRQTLTVAADRAWPTADSAIDGALGVQVENLGTWGAWVPAGWRLAGQLEAALRIDGRLEAPQLTGAVYGRELGLRNALEGVALREGELQARFDGARAELTRLRFRAGDGELRVAGEARLGAQPEARLTLDADRATVLGRVDRRVVASGQATARLDAERIAVDGSLRVDEGLIDISQSDAPALGDDVTVLRRTAASKAPEQPPPPQTPRAVDLKLLVQLGERLQLRGRGIDTRLEGELRLTTPGGKLAANGEIRTERGTYEAYGQKLEITQGVITFVGDLANPRLAIEAVRANTDTRVGVIVGGSAQSPRVRLFSEPELPATEKLALLVTGRNYDSLGGSETLLLQRAALALLAGDGDGSGGKFDVARLLQLDELSVRQSDGAVRDTVVTLGKQLSERVYVGYERGMNAAAGNWQLIYRIARRFTLRAQSGEDPAVDLIWLFKWN